MKKQDSMSIRPLAPEDWPFVRAIYKEGIATGNATFEDDAPPWEEWDSAHLRDGRLVASLAGTVVGWAALSPVSGRCVYSGVAEDSVYVSAAARGIGVGRKLLQALVEESEAKGYWTIQAGIFPENEASLALHTTCGFRLVGRRERLGAMDGRWRDVILMERRSSAVGT
jgi:L-amino acid N-acyltransferase YncA